MRPLFSFYAWWFLKPEEVRQMKSNLSPAMFAGKLGLVDAVEHAEERDGETVGAFFEEHWKFISGNSQAMGYILRAMKRKFKRRPRKKQLNGEYVKIRGFTSFERWFCFATGKSIRSAYYALRTEEKKHNKNSRKVLSSTDDFIDCCLDRIETVLKPLGGDAQRRKEILQTLAEKLQH
jgi:hypothetical protein